MTHVHYSSGTLADGTTTKTYNFGFTAAAGAPLVLAIHAAATATTPSGWTLNTSNVSSTGAYIFTKVATGGETSVTWTQNGPRAAAVAVWEFAPTSTFGYYASFFTGGTTSQTADLYGSGTFIQIRLPFQSSNTPFNMTWTGSGTKVADVNSYTPIDNATAAICAYQIDYSASGTYNLQASLAATNTMNIQIVDNVTTSTCTTLAQYSGTPATTHTITFTTPSTAGSDVILFGLSGATVTLPTNWVSDHSSIITDHNFVWRLPGASNTGISSVTLTLNASAQLAAVVIQDYVSERGYKEMTTGDASTSSGGSLFTTGLHTTTANHVLYSVLWNSNIVSSNYGSPVATALDKGYTIMGQKVINPTSTSLGHLIVVGQKPIGWFVAAGVIGTFSPVIQGTISSNSAKPGMVGYVRRTVGTDTTAPTVTSRTPAPSALGVSVSTTVNVGFSESVTGVSITMNQAGTNVPGTVTGTGATRVFTPSSTLSFSTVYTVVVSGATDLSSNVQVGSSTWSFTTSTSSGYAFGSTIAEEISLPGTSSSFMAIGGAGDLANQGFARQMSTNAGSTVQFSVSGDCQEIDIFRVGGYDTGWRKVGQIVNTPTTQPAAATITSSNGATTCEAWSVTASWTIPVEAWSGLHVALVRNASLSNGSWIPFVVRNDSRTADVVVKTSDTTWGMAYNHYGTQSGVLGGACLYGIGGIGDITQRSHAVTLDRPVITRQGIEQTYWTNAESALWRFLDKQGISWKLISSGDLDEGLTKTTGAKVLVSSGHDEYWSDGMRDNAEAFRDAGGHLIFMSGNEVFWRIRFTTDRRTIWCYKDTMAGPGAHVAGTPLDPVTWTGTWKDTRWGGRKPENTITGTDFRMNGVINFDAVVSATTYGSSPFWRGTTVAGGASLTIPKVIGFEADRVAPVKAGTESKQLVGTTVNINGRYADNNGQDYGGNGDLPWGIMLQKYGDSIVAGFGTCQWSWALDADHARESTTPVVQAQQATLNLLADMGALPTTPTSGLSTPTPVAWSTYGLTDNASSTIVLGNAEAAYAGTGLVTKIYRGNVLVWTKPAPVAQTKLIANYAATTAATSYVISFASATDPAKALLAIGHAGAQITMPSGWTETRLSLASTHLAIWRLSAVDHTTPLTSITVGLSAARKLAMVIVEDDMFDSGQTLLTSPRLSDTTWTTGARSATANGGLVFYTFSADDNSLTPEVSSYDQGFNALADTGDMTGAINNEATRIYVASKSSINLSDQAVIMTLNSPGITAADTNFSGLLTWNRTEIIDTSLSLFSGTPSISHDAADSTPLTTGTEFYVNAPTNLIKVRYIQPTNGNSDQRVARLYTVDSDIAGTVVAGPFTLPTPTNGQWCEYTLPTPYTLVPYQRYRIGIYHPHGIYPYYPGGHYFDSSGPGTTTTTIGGVLVRPNAASVAGNDQGSFANDVHFPDSSFNAGNYYSDVVVEPITPTLIAEDTFDRANATGASAVGNGWTPELSSLINISSNSLQWQPGGGSGYQRVSTTFPSDPAITGNIIVEADLTAAALNAGYTGVLCRYNYLDNTGVRVLFVSPTSITVGNAVGYNVSDISLTTPTFPAGWASDALNTLRVELIGSRINVYGKTTTVPGGQLITTGTIAQNAGIADGGVGFCGEANGKLFGAIRVYQI